MKAFKVSRDATVNGIKARADMQVTDACGFLTIVAEVSTGSTYVQTEDMFLREAFTLVLNEEAGRDGIDFMVVYLTDSDRFNIFPDVPFWETAGYANSPREYHNQLKAVAYRFGLNACIAAVESL